MKNINFLFLFFILLLTIPAYSQVDTLTINDCIEIALKNNPQIKLAESNVELSSSNLKSTMSVLYPQVSFQTGWTRNGGTSFIGPIVRAGYYNNYSYGFQLQQLVFDFGKTYSKISASSDLNNASKQDYISAEQNLIMNTYISYFAYLQAQRVLKVSNETLKQTEEHLTQAKALFSVGRSPQFDVLKARTDLDNAKVNLITAESNLRISKLQLENVLNKKLGDNYFFQDNLEVSKDTIDEAAAISTALKNRPELIASKYKVEASKSQLTSAWTSNLPSINVAGGYNWKNYIIDTKFPDSWNVGVTLSLPLFQGFALDAGIDQARASLKNSEAQNDLTTQAVMLDVQQQFANFQVSMSQISATKSLVDQAALTLKTAEGRYAQGVGSPLEITDAQVGYFNAQTLYIQTLYNYQVAYVRLHRAMGILK